MKPPQIIKLERKYRDLRSPMVLGDNSIFLSNYFSRTFALDRSTYAVQWAVKGPTIEAVHQDVVVVRNGAAQRLSGLCASEGVERWRGPDRGLCQGIWNGHLLFLREQKLHLVAAASGESVEIPIPVRPNFLGPVVGDLLMLCEGLRGDPPLSTEPRVFALDLRARCLAWDRLVVDDTPPGGAPTGGSFLPGDTSGNQFFFVHGSALSVCGAENGDVRWCAPFDRRVQQAIVTGDKLLEWSGDRLTGRKTSTGEIVFEMAHPPLGDFTDARPGLVHDRFAVVFAGGIEVIDLAGGVIVNRYDRHTGFVGAAMLEDGRLLVGTSRELRVFDNSIFVPARTRVQKGPRAIPKPRAFKSQRLVAEVLGKTPDEQLVFETLPRIVVHGVDRFKVPVATEGPVLVAGDPIGLYALAPSTYSLLWQAPEIKNVDTPVVHTGFVMVPDWQNRLLYGRRLESGRPAWSVEYRDRYCLSGDFMVVMVGERPRVQLFDPRAAKAVVEFDPPLPALMGVTEKVAVLCDRVPDGDGFPGPLMNPFVGMDLRDGRELWRRDFGGNVEAIQDGVIVLALRDRLEGRSIQTGDVMWNHPGGFMYRAGPLWWDTRYEQRYFDVLDITSGRVTRLPAQRGAGAGAALGGGFNDYAVAFAGNGTYFFHLTRPAQRLPLKVDSDTRAVQAGNDLILSCDGKLRPMRRMR